LKGDGDGDDGVMAVGDRFIAWGSSIVRQRGQSEKSRALGLEVIEEFAGGGAAGTIGADG